MLPLLDQGCFILHTLLIVFNLVGWAWKPTRLLHLITFGLTAFSWFVLGAFYNWGYCLCADWHFKIREQLGYEDKVGTYIQLMATHYFGVDLSYEASNWIGGSVF